MTLPEPWLPAAFALAALLYSSVGHGGASAYLALGALAGMSRVDLAPMALTMNVVVAGLAAFRFRSHLRRDLLLPLLGASIPAAFLGARLHLSTAGFAALLGIALFFSGLRLLRPGSSAATTAPRVRPTGPARIVVPLSGGVIGLASGMLGIGGGVFLSPLVLFLRWADMKEAAALSSTFIVCNSLSGLLSYATSGQLPQPASIPLFIAAMSGGFVGSWMGAHRLSSQRLAPLLGCVLVFAAAKLWLLAAG